MATFYVSTTGNDTTGNGSVGSPYRTITKGYSVTNPGDTVFVRGGTYAEKVLMNRSGSSGLPITIAAYPGETPIVNGATLSATGYYDSLVTMTGSYNTVDGLTVRNFEYYDPTGGQYVGVSGPWWGGEGIQIYPYTTNNTIRNCTINHIGAFGIVAAGNNQLIEYNILYDVGYPYAYYLPSLPSWGSVISIQTTTGDSLANIRSGTICRYNRIYESIAEGVIFMRVRNGACYGNEVYDCTAPHLYFTNSDHIACYNNIVYATSVSWTLFSTRGPGRGIAVGNEYAYNPDGTSYLDIYNNLVYNTAHPFTYFIQPATQGFAQLANCNIVNNQFLDGNQSSGAYGNAATTVTFTTGNITNTTFRNNVITQTNAAYAIFSASTLTGLTISHNRWGKAPSGLTLDANSSVGDPLLARSGPTTSGLLTGEYFRPQSGSPVLAAGTPLALVPTDYFGITRSNPPSIGAIDQVTQSDWEPVSSPKTYVDIGSPAAAGQADYSPSLLQYRVIASGADMWGTADSFGGFYETRSGDFTLTYKVESQVGGGASYKAGCDVRTALTAGARHVSINQTGGGVIQRLIRTADDGTTSAANAVTANAWHRIARSGNSLITAHSADGATWTTVATDDITGWPSSLYILQIECANGTSLATATYSNWVLTSEESSVITALGGGDATLTTEVAEQLDAAILAAGDGSAVLTTDYTVPQGAATGGAVLGHTNRIDAASLSGGSWNASYPLANLKTRYLQQKARSSNALTGSTVINLDLGAARSIGVVALIAHNLTADNATVRIQGANNAGQSPTLYDSEALPVYQGTDYALTFPEASARYWRISMADTGNTAGYVTLGRIFIGSRFKPTWGASFGSAIGIGSNSVVKQASGGNKFARKRATWRTWKMDFNYLSDAEGYGALLAILRAHDITEEFYVIIDAADTLYRGERHMLCSVKQLPAMAHPYVDLNSIGLELEELV